MLEAGTDIDIVDKNGKTAFDRALAREDEEMMRILEKAQKEHKEKVRNFEKSEVGQRILGIWCYMLCSKTQPTVSQTDNKSEAHNALANRP